ncbi:hypothetical protein JJV70_02005 [Streptomyces sp. JJ66]|uniref:hypothetical protein n=1 Tax=Streptomyces sp. JJ66 TaxID=2803843 RepID=UPI001C56C038|nr:hypothetical protein [Streptomyces sp. JJ66]MBW1600894.1 hypothetical protein [Streptomyces sp. JJ66]
MSGLHRQAVTIVRAPLITDRYGSERRDWANAVRTLVSGVEVQPAAAPAASQEDTIDRQTAVTGWRLYTRRGVDVDLLETDRVEYDGMTLEVDGKIGRWRMGGRVHHVEAELKEID